MRHCLALILAGLPMQLRTIEWPESMHRQGDARISVVEPNMLEMQSRWRMSLRHWFFKGGTSNVDINMTGSGDTNVCLKAKIV